MDYTAMKKQHWEKIKPKYAQYEQYCHIEVFGLDDMSTYFYHPHLILDEKVRIIGQCSIYTDEMYGYNILYNLNKIEIDEKDVDVLIKNYEKYKDVIIKLLEYHNQLYKYADTLRNYADDYLKQIISNITLSTILRQKGEKNE